VLRDGRSSETGETRLEDRLQATEVGGQMTEDRGQQFNKEIRKLGNWFKLRVLNGLPFTVYRLRFDELTNSLILELTNCL
jgi:hypothetical protein